MGYRLMNFFLLIAVYEWGFLCGGKVTSPINISLEKLQLVLREGECGGHNGESQSLAAIK